MVTGAGGFIGKNLMAAISQVPCRILTLSRQAISSVQGIAELRPVRGDLLNLTSLDPLVSEAIDVVFHLAGQTSSKKSAEVPVDDLRANCQCTLELLEHLRRFGRKPTVVFASTATTVGLTSTRPTTEAIQERPLTLYDIHKLSAEHYIRYYAENGLINGASLRLTNVYGGGAAVSSADRGILNKVIARALRGEPIFVFKPGTWLRDYIYISDVIDALLSAGQFADRTGGRPYFVGSGEGTTVKDAFELVIERVARKTGVRSKLEYKNPPETLAPIEFRNFVADTSAFARETGWRPMHSLADGIDRTIVDLLNAKNDK